MIDNHAIFTLHQQREERLCDLDVCPHIDIEEVLGFGDGKVRYWHWVLSAPVLL